MNICDVDKKSKADDYIYDMLIVSDECEKRMKSNIVDVRYDALRKLLVASEKCKTIVFPRPDVIFSVLTVENYHSKESNYELNQEIGRCLAVICSNICSVKDGEKANTLTEKDKKVMTYTRLGTSELLVPTLLAFGDNRSTEYLLSDIETNKQIIHLLSVLYGDDVSQYTNMTQDMLKAMIAKIKERLKVKTRLPAYVKMHESLTSTLNVLEAYDKKQHESLTSTLDVPEANTKSQK